VAEYTGRTIRKRRSVAGSPVFTELEFLEYSILALTVICGYLDRLFGNPALSGT
jgi:hypothetical protein